MSEFGEQLDLPVHGEARAICSHSGRRYVLKNDRLEAVDA
jgi:UDP-2-acetamido-3-amino-2,3-dideoxy-glucuronate N-acetyltransferase